MSRRNGTWWARVGLKPLNHGNAWYLVHTPTGLPYQAHTSLGIRRDFLPMEERWMILSKRGASGPGRGCGLGSSVPEDGWSSTYPGIWQMLTAQCYPDGTTRQTSTLLIYWDDGSVKLCLTDRDNEVVAWQTSLKGMEDALACLERRLQEGVVEWRRKKEWTPPRKR